MSSRFSIGLGIRIHNLNRISYINLPQWLNEWNTIWKLTRRQLFNLRRIVNCSTIIVLWILYFLYWYGTKLISFRTAKSLTSEDPFLLLMNWWVTSPTFRVFSVFLCLHFDFSAHADYNWIETVSVFFIEKSMKMTVTEHQIIQQR